MKRFLLWVVGVILGVAVLLGAVMTVSYSFTGEGARPAADTQFGGQALEVNGSCWQVPLLGGVFDKVFTSPETLTVQKLGGKIVLRQPPDRQLCLVIPVGREEKVLVLRG